MKKVAGLIWSI